MRKITLLTFLFLTVSAFSQNFEWVKTPPITFNGNGDLIGYSTACDPSGDIYIAGFKENTFLHGGVYGDMMYNKYNAAGELLFSKTFTGHAAIYDMTSDSDGNILVSAGYVNIFSVDNLQLSTTEQGTQNLLLKFDSQGNLLWHQQFEIEDWIECTFHSVTTDADNNIYVGYYDFMNSYIKKLAPDGTTLLTIPQMNVRMISSLSVDDAGNIYAAGSCADPDSSFDGVSVPPNFDYNTFVVKYAPSGAYQWVRFVDDITCTTPQVVARAPDEIYFSSYLFGNYMFDDIQSEGPNSMFSDIFITRLNSEGVFQWMREVPGDGVVKIGTRRYLSADDAGNVYFVGSTRFTINWNDQITTSVAGFSENALILQYDKNGNLLMAKTAGGESNDRIDAVEISPTGEILIAGMARANASFDGFQFEAEPFQYWPFLAKMTNVALGTKMHETQNIGFYPNPTSDFINVAGNVRNISGKIYNMLGQEVMDFEIGSEHPAAIHLLPKGTYLIKPNGSKATKLIKN